MSESVEFVGGPLDGETMEIARHYCTWRIPLANPQMNVWTSLAEQLEDVAWKPMDLRTGVYRRSGRNPRCMVWDGEE